MTNAESGTPNIILKEGVDFNLLGDYALKLITIGPHYSSDSSYSCTPQIHFYSEAVKEGGKPGSFKANVGLTYRDQDGDNNVQNGVLSIEVHSGNVTLIPNEGQLFHNNFFTQVNYTVSGGCLAFPDHVPASKSKVHVSPNGTLSVKNLGVTSGSTITIDNGGILEIRENDTIENFKVDEHRSYHFLNDLSVTTLEHHGASLSVEGKLKADQSVVISGNGIDEVKLKAGSVDTTGDLSVENALLDIKESIKVGARLHAQNAKISSPEQWG